MSCSYSDIAMYEFDMKALGYNPQVSCWKRFRDDIFLLWKHGEEELEKFFNFMNGIDETGKIQFTMVSNPDNSLEFLDLKLQLRDDQISVDVYSKPTNSFTYVCPSTCFPKRNIKNIPTGIARRIRRVCDTGLKYAKRSREYQNYLIARGYDW